MSAVQKPNASNEKAQSTVREYKAGRLHRELQALPEWERVGLARAFRGSIHVFIRNYNQFERALRMHGDPGNIRELWAVRHHYRLSEFQLELLRLLHNFVASAQSLIDHTRVLYSAICKARGLFPEYQSEVRKRFGNDGVSSFVVGLRQYCQHYRPPPLLSRLSFESPTMKTSVLLSRAELLKFSGWRSAAKSFLVSCTDDIDVLAVVAEYFERVRTFHEWFEQRLREVLRPDFEKVRDWKKSFEVEFPRDIPRGLRSHLRSLRKTTLWSLEEGFVGILTDDEWRALDEVPADPNLRAAALIRMLRARGINNEQLEKELVEKFKAISSSQEA